MLTRADALGPRRGHRRRAAHQPPPARRPRPAHRRRLRGERASPSTPAAEQLALALASQAGICLENAILYEEIQNLFAGFVDAAVTAIESRDPTTSGHSRRVATLTRGAGRAGRRPDRGPLRRPALHPGRAAPDRVRRRAARLRQGGRARERAHQGQEALRRPARRHRPALPLHPQEHRVRGAAAASWTWALAGRARRARAVRRARPRHRPRGCASWRRSASSWPPPTSRRCWPARPPPSWPRSARLEYLDVDGARRPYLEPGELEALRIERGSLTDGERQQIQSHVTHTLSFLETIPWSRIAARRPPHRRRPPRVARRPRLPLRPAGRRDPGRVAHDDHRRHLRRPHRLRPPLQGRRPGPARARRSSSPRSRPAAATPTCSPSSWAPRSTAACCSRR